MRWSVFFFTFLMAVTACSSDPGSETTSFEASSEPPVATGTPPPYATPVGDEVTRVERGTDSDIVTRPHVIDARGEIAVPPCDGLRLCAQGLQRPHLHQP
jgi:hypothetical protein